MDDLESPTENSPLVSVLVTVYNREKYLAETIKSILESSWTNFEVIVVDDASSDSSLSVAHSYARNDDRLKVFANKQNLGDYGNRAKAASLAQGKYIKYVDSDDLIYKYSLAIMVESLEKNPDAALALSHSMPEATSPYPWSITPHEVYRKHFLRRGCLNCGPSGAIIRRVAFEAVGGFREHWKVISDTDLWLRLAARWPTVLLPPGLIWWRRHADQEYTKDSANLVYLARGLELAANALMSNECPLTQTEIDAALKKKRQHFSRKVLSLGLRDRELSSALKLYRASGLSLSDLAKGFRSYQ